MRTTLINDPSDEPAGPPLADVEPRLAELIGDLARAGLVSVEVDPGGELAFALTPSGQQAARLMSMSRDPYALVLLGALAGASTDLH